MASRSRWVFFCALSAVAGFWLGWMANAFIAQDRCLDAGGSWNDQTRFCELQQD